MTIAIEQRKLARGLISDELFDRLVNRIVNDDNVERRLAERIMDQALAFLAACGKNQEALSPSKLVDIGWHTFLMYTQEYMEFCHRHAGRFIHHVPTDEHTKQAVGEALSSSPLANAKTAEVIERAGYHVDTELWNDMSDCGPDPFEPDPKKQPFTPPGPQGPGPSGPNPSPSPSPGPGMRTEYPTDS